jgi:hypothetical protein
MYLYAQGLSPAGLSTSRTLSRVRSLGICYLWYEILRSVLASGFHPLANLFYRYFTWSDIRKLNFGFPLRGRSYRVDYLALQV